MQDKAALALRELATLIDAGLPVEQAYQKTLFAAAANAASGLTLLQQGRPLSEALRKTGLLTPAQRALLAASETSGQQSEALCWLADSREARLMRLRTFRSRLIISVFILMLGLILSSLVVAANRPEGLFTILGGNVLGTLPLLLLIVVIHHAGNKDAWWWLGKLWPWRSSTLGRRLFAVSWLRLFAWQLRAGLDATQALATLRPLINHRACQQATAQAMQQVKNGDSLMQAFGDSGLLFDPAIRSALHTGEASGRLTESLRSRVALHEQQLDSFLDELFLWLPRGLYVVAVGTALSMLL